MPSDIFGPLPVDALTGLPGRADLQARLAETCNVARRLGQPLALLALDFDHFKELNARHFLTGGDQVLVAVARLILSLARPDELVFRDGGDQFTLILSGVEREEAFREAERFRRAIATAPLEVQSAGGAAAVSVTVSIGVATLEPSDAETWEVFLRAREALHRAKGSGRNRVA
jgi:two-component system cell cycle response regulator